MLADAHVDQTIIKKIVGHAGAMTLTERVYTHLDIHELIEAIDKIWKIGIVSCALLVRYLIGGNITIPNGVVTIGHKAFSGCANLQSVSNYVIIRICPQLHFFDTLFS